MKNGKETIAQHGVEYFNDADMQQFPPIKAIRDKVIHIETLLDRRYY